MKRLTKEIGSAYAGESTSLVHLGTVHARLGIVPAGWSVLVPFARSGQAPDMSDFAEVRRPFIHIAPERYCDLITVLRRRDRSSSVSLSRAKDESATCST